MDGLTPSCWRLLLLQYCYFRSDNAYCTVLQLTTTKEVDFTFLDSVHSSCTVSGNDFVVRYIGPRAYSCSS